MHPASRTDHPISTPGFVHNSIFISQATPHLGTTTTTMDSPSRPFDMISRMASFPTLPVSSPSRSHTERPYKCIKRGCLLRFERRFTLKEHLKTHTGAKPFMCPVKTCGKTFTTSGTLARHKRTHEWLMPLVCLIDGCDQSFMNELKLEDHMKCHFKGPPMVQVCPIADCDKQFSTAGNLMRHFKQHYPYIPLAESTEVNNAGVGDVAACQANVFCHTRMFYDPSRAYNPLMNEVSDVSDAELLATLQCLF